MMNPEPHAMHRWLQQLLGDWTCESLADMGPGEPPRKAGAPSKCARWAACGCSAMGRAPCPAGAATPAC